MKTLIFMKENDNFSVSRNSEVSAFPRRMSCLSSFAFYMDVSVQFSRSVMSDSLQSHEMQYTRLPQLSELAQTHVHPVGDAIQTSHFLSFPSPPAFNLSQHQGFPMSWLFIPGGQSIGVSASASVLPLTIQG